MPSNDDSNRQSRSLQLYLSKAIPDEDLLLRVWAAADEVDRPQRIFRQMLTAGLLAMIENGQMPEAIIDACNLDMLIEKKIRRKRRRDEAKRYNDEPSTQPVYPYPAYHPSAGHVQAPHGYPAPVPPYYPPQYPAYPEQGQPQQQPLPQMMPQPVSNERMAIEPTPPPIAKTVAPVTKATATDEKVAADKTSGENKKTAPRSVDDDSFGELM